MHILIYDIRILETVATEVWYSCLTKGHKLSHFRWCLFKFYNILTRFSICFFYYYHTFNLYADESEHITHKAPLLHVYVFMRLPMWFTWCIWVRDCIRSLVHICAWTCVCAWILQLGTSVHVHYISQSMWGASQHGCASACSELSAPAGCAIPIYPSAKEVGGKSAGHRCRRFHIRGTRLPVRRPLRGGDEGGRLPRHSVGVLGLFGVGRSAERREGRATPESVGSVFSGKHSCQAAHLFDTRRSGMPVRGCRAWFTSLRLLVCCKNLDKGSVSAEIQEKLC